MKRQSRKNLLFGEIGTTKDMAKNRSDVLFEYIGKLDMLDQEIIKMRLGLVTGEEMTFKYSYQECLACAVILSVNIWKKNSLLGNVSRRIIFIWN